MTAHSEMKRVISFALIFIMLLASSCKNKNDGAEKGTDIPNAAEQTEDIVDKTENTDNSAKAAEDEKEQEQPPAAGDEPLSVNDTSKYNFGKGDSEIIELASKTEFNEDIVFEWAGEKVTVQKPIFTGLPVTGVYSYKDYYRFNSDNLESINVSGYKYFTIDKNGKIISDDDDKPLQNNEVPEPYEDYGLDKEQIGEFGSYRQRLYTLDGEPVSEYFDCIGSFYKGLALIKEDNKLGIIYYKGNVLLEPVIAFDRITYPPTGREYQVAFIINDAFIIPIGGELAVINIKR